MLFKVRTLRSGSLIDGRRVLAGLVVAVGAAEAADLIIAGDAVLLADEDLPRLAAALWLHNGSRRPTAA